MFAALTTYDASPVWYWPWCQWNFSPIL